MGISISRNTDLTQNEFLLQFVGKEHITPNDPLWNRLLAFNVKIPTTSNEQLALDSKIEPLCQKLLSNNLRSGNIGTVVQILLIKASELLAANNIDDNLFCWQLLNVLFLVRCILKYLTETLTEEQLTEHLEINATTGSRLEALIGTLVGILVDVPQKDSTYAIHLEAVTTLLILLSIQIHSSRRAEESNVYKLVMRGKHVIHAPLLVKNLLQNFMEQKSPPPGFMGNNSHSIVLGIASGLWSILTFNAKSTDEAAISEHGDFREAPLATQSLLLLLVLVHHCTAQANPYRLSLFTCINSQDNSPVPPTKAHSVFKIDYGGLYVALCKKATGDSATLLLYLLLHRNAAFKTHLLNRLDLDQLVIPVLRTLYNAPNSNSHHIYMSLIILLIFSEDDTFNRTIHETKLKNILWYTERNLSEVTLGGLLVLVVIRTVQYNMLKMRDKYLHTNCLAALANMSSQFRNLHPYVSQRLVSLFETLAKRYLRLSERLDEKPPEVSVSIVDDNVDMKQDVAVLEEVLRMVLEIFNSCLSSQLINNPNLVYTMLYKRSVFEVFKDAAAFRDVVENIELIINYFSELLSSKSQTYEVDAQQVLLTIQQGAKHWPKDKLKKFPELKFKYVEEDQPEEFFIPYVWELVCQESTLHWRTDNSAILGTA